MSLVNILMTRDRAFIATDTQATFAGTEVVVGRILGSAIKTPKILPLPHARCVLAHRSNTPASERVLAALLQDFESFDLGLTAVPELAQSAAEGTAREFGFSSLDLAPHELRNLQLFLVGWSESQGCMGMLTTWFEGTKQRTMRLFGDAAQVTRCLSCPGSVKAMPESAAEMAMLSRAWVAEERERKGLGALGVGGTLVVTEITANTIAQTYCGDLGFHPDAKVSHLRNEAEPVMLQIASVPQVQTEGIAPDAVTQGATTDTGYGIATIASDAAAANRNAYTFKTLSNTVDVTFTGSGSPVILTATGGALELDTESTNSPTVAGFCMELRDGSTPLKTVSTFGNLVSIVGGVANNDGGGHGTYNFSHARGSLSLAHELAGYTGSKTFHLVFGYLLLNASGAPVAPGTTSYKNSLQVSDAILTVKEYKR